MHEFETLLFRQQAYWVSELVIDALASRVLIQLVANPNSQEIDSEVIFSEIKNVSVDFYGEHDESKDDYLCNLLGITNSDQGGSIKYIITTDTVEVSFCTESKPNIKRADPNIPYQKWSEEKIIIGASKNA